MNENLTDKKIIKITWFTNIDLLRLFALFMVNTVHFWQISGLPELTISGIRLFFSPVIWMLGITGVPIFIMITGYLMKEKTLSKNYYKGLFKIIVIYVLCAITCLLVQYFTDARPTFTNIYSGIRHTFSMLFNYSLAPYGWYVEMYICLFLLIPFLNACYKGIKNKHNRQILCFTLFFLTILPSLINSFNIEAGSFLRVLFNNTNNYTQFLPYYFKPIYPIAYYFIGCYMKDYKFKCGKLPSFLFGLFILCFSSFWCYITYYGGLFNNASPLAAYFSVSTCLVSILIFNFFIKINTIAWPALLKRFLKNTAGLVYGAYLLSAIADRFVYGFVYDTFSPVVIDRIYFYPWLVFIVFLCSLLLSYFLNLIYKVILKLFFKRWFN